MLVLLLIACDDDSTGAALGRADAFLEENPRGTAIVQVPVGREGIEAVVGTTWHGHDLAAWLAPCGDVAAFDAVLQLEAGTFPAERYRPDELPRCVDERLRAFPFDGPSRRGDTDVVSVRWRPGEEGPEVTVRSAGGGGLPAGVVELAPPYYRRAPDGDALETGRDLRFAEGRVRIRPDADAPLEAGALASPEAWARQLACPADTLDLVRVTLAFEGGSLEESEVWPENDCVAEKIDEARAWMRERPIGGTTLARAGNVLVVLDVPVGAW